MDSRWRVLSGRRSLVATLAFCGALMLSSVAIAAAKTSKNAIRNGSFTHGLTGWTTGPAGHPNAAIGAENLSGWSWMAQCAKFQGTKPFLAENVPAGNVGFAQQTVKVPRKGVLSFRTWGNLDPVTATIVVITANHAAHTVLTYTPPTLQGSGAGGCSGSKPVWKSVNLSKFAGKTVTLRAAATSSGTDGTFADFDYFTLKKG